MAVTNPPTVSTANDAITALLDKIRGLPECAAPVLVTDGFPGPGQPDTIVGVGGTTNSTVGAQQRWASLGAGRKDDIYDLECVISAYAGGSDQSAVRSQAWTIFQAIGAALRGDASLGGIVLWCGIDKWRMVQTSAEDASAGRYCEITFYIHCEARI